VAVFSRSAVTGGLTFVEVQEDGVGGVDGLDAPFTVAVSPDGDRLYVAAYDDDSVAVFARSVVTGGLTFVEVQHDGVDGLDGAYSVVASPDGHHVYVTGSFDNAVAVFNHRRRRVLFDEAHDEANTLSLTRASQLSPGHPDWVYFGDLATELQDEFIFERNPDASITYALLENYDVLMLSAPQAAFDAGEIAAIRLFVSSGGDLVVLGECGLDHPANDLMTGYEISFDPHCIWAPIPVFGNDFPVTNFASHPAVAGVSSFVTNWGQSLLYGSGATRLAWSSADAWQDTNRNNTYDSGTDLTGPFTIVAGYDTGCGRVMAVSDNSFQDDGFEWRQNYVLMRSLLRWAEGGQECELVSAYLPLVLRNY